MTPLNDQALIQAILQGGQAREAAANQLLDQHLGFIHSLTRRFKLPEAAVADAYTDSLLLTLDHIINGRFRGEAKISTYLYQIIFNKCRDLSKKKATNTISWEDWTESWEPSSQDFLQEFLSQEKFEQVNQQLLQLGEPCRQIILDWGYWGYSMPEIAQRAGLESADQAKRKKYKCLQRLLKKLLPNG